MSDNRTKETSLAGLKRAIEDVPAMPALSAPDWVIQMKARYRQQAEAWRTAFEWRDSLINCSDASSRRGEYLEGMRLIREKLK